MFAPASLLRRIAGPARGLVLLALGTVSAQTALEPAQGGADFGIQGEYLGTVAGGPQMGVQVVALGSGRFKAVFLSGGLPGAGWNGRDRTEAQSAGGGKASFSGNGYSASIDTASRTLSGETPEGAEFTCGKVARISPSEGAAPPEGALVLFDGSGLDPWKAGTAEMDARNFFRPIAGAISKESFASFTLHLEFRVPFMPASAGQARGNSGVYLQSRYELQILDSFGASPAGADSMLPKRECGAFWEQFPPLLNMAYPPLSWQTYDIAFTAAEFDAAGNRAAPARITVRWNGETVHADRSMLNRTLGGDPEGPAPGSLHIQDHGDPVYFRNIWIVRGTPSIGLGERPHRRRAALHREGESSYWTVDGRALSSTASPLAKAPRPAAGFFPSRGSEGNAGNPHLGRLP